MSTRLHASTLFVLLPLFAACGHPEEAAHEDVRPVRSTVVGESKGSIGATYSGQIRARHEIQLGFQTSGKILTRLVEVGSQVKRGQPLMRLDHAQEALHLASAAADVDAARSRVAQNRTDLQRTEQLLQRQFASQAEVDQQRLALSESESQLRSALAQQEIKQNQRGYTELLADRDGVVVAIDAEAGQVVASGQAVVTLAGDGEREVLVSVPESRVEELRQARNLQISIWADPKRRYHGQLRELAPDADSVTRTYSARITIQDADAALLLGMTASVFAPDVAGTSAIRLPLSAIYQKEAQPLVWIVDRKTSQVSTRAVQIAGAQDDSVLIASGLRTGETVVTAGVHMLHPGQQVLVLAPSHVAATKLAKAD
jgi:RND family efflux transporter MFP subunit